MPADKDKRRIKRIRQKNNGFGHEDVPRSLLPVEQEETPSHVLSEEAVSNPYQSFSFPGFNIDEFPTTPMPLMTIESWPTQPIPQVVAQMPRLPAPVESEYSPDGSWGTWLSQERKTSATETPLQPQDEVAPAANYVEVARNLAKSSGIYALAALGPPLVSLVLAPFLAHHLSPTSYGILAVLTTVISLMAGITQLGLSSAFFRAYSYDYTGQQERRAVLATVTALLSLVSIPMAIVSSLLAAPLAGVLLNRPTDGSLITLTVWVVVAQNLTVPGFSWLRAEDRPVLFSVLSLCNIVIVLCANLILVGLLRMGVAGSLLATGIGYASVALSTLPVILWRTKLRMRKDVAWSLLTFGAPLILSYISYWVLQVSDRYLLSFFVSLAQTASYAVAYSLGSVLSTLVISPFSLAWPAAMFSIAKREDAPQVFRLVFRWFGIILLFVAFALSIAGSLLLDWLFPNNYHSAGPIIPVIAESMVFYGLYSVFMTGASIKRKTWIHAVFTAVAALVNLLLNLVLIPHFGAGGAAASTLIAYILLALVAYLANQRIFPIPYEMGRFLFALLLGFALFVGTTVASLEWGGFWRWLLTIACLVLYGTCLLFLGEGVGFLRARSRLITRIFLDRRVS